MTKLMKTLSFAAILVSTLSHSQAFSTNNELNNLFENEVLIYNPNIKIEGDSTFVEMACYGCASSETGRPRTNYVKPHYRSNGTYVSGYWRS